MQHQKYSKFLLILLFPFLASCAREKSKTIIPSSSQQVIVVLSDSLQSTTGSLYRFEVKSENSEWLTVGNKMPVVLGRSGLGWGQGLDSLSNTLDYPLKKEGDGRSPAGMFYLSLVFGYQAASEMEGLKMPYSHVTEVVECIDDVNSKYYNEIVSRDQISETDTVDWKSSEKMRFAGISYELGVFVDHNTGQDKNNFGSCIFLHNWSSENATTAGCTAMSPENMKAVAFWLDSDKKPVLIQLTKEAAQNVARDWALPEMSY